MGERRHTGQDVTATFGVSQILQRFGQPHTDHTGRSDGDRQVAERFIG